ncbi:hypothetical protein [Deinococcus sp. QL22]|uniref:hypothetical protein n=1 Tax=Deinococcus sp. QL22 TaxID=2939437 RepID=UPI002017042C|nr:hypothetical protein [Deinococcus sp. QL22]UQN06381.1 hypothetical protein M1R55_00195 [Deinococcus sp. QL22]
MKSQTALIADSNFIPCLQLLANVGDVELDAGIQSAFEGGLIGTDEEDTWYEWPVGKLVVAVKRDEIGMGLIWFRVQVPHGFTRAVDVVLHACGSYRLNEKAML